MTIDEHINTLVEHKNDESGLFRLYARTALLEVARDQRHACVEALHTVGHDGFLNYHETHQAVMNAEIKR
jgi:hypothetical protein